MAKAQDGGAETPPGQHTQGRRSGRCFDSARPAHARPKKRRRVDAAAHGAGTTIIKKCSICGGKIKEDGWGAQAYCTSDGSAYIHHKCQPAPTPSPAPKPAQNRPAEPHSPPSDFLTLPDAARLIGVSSSTLRRRIKNGSLPAFRLDGGQTLLIERTALLRLLRPA